MFILGKAQVLLPSAVLRSVRW